MVILIDSGCTNNFLDESMWLALILPLSSKDTLEVQMVNGAILRTNIVFGWVDFRGDGKYRRENLSFPLFGNERKMGGVEN